MSYIAPLSKRIVAWLVDNLIILGITVPLSIALIGYHPREISLLRASVASSTAIFLPLLYYTIFEGLASSTPGKRVMGIYVLTYKSLEPIDLRRAFIRNLVRIADMFLMYLPVLINEDRRRLGDGAGGTVVVHNEVSLRLLTPERFAERISKESEGLSIATATTKAFLEVVRSKALTISEEELKLVIRKLCASSGFAEEDLRAKAKEAFGSDDVGSLIAYIALSRKISIGGILTRRDLQNMLLRASEIAFLEKDRATLRREALLLSRIGKLSEGSHTIKPKIAEFLREVVSRTPDEFRGVIPYFLLAITSFMVITFLSYMFFPESLIKKAVEMLGIRPGVSKMNHLLLSLLIIVNNVRVALIAIGGGPTVVCPPLLAIANGIIVGGVEVMFKGRYLFYLSGLLPHGVLEITAIMSTVAIGMRMGIKTILPPRGKSRYEILEEIALGNLHLAVFALILLCISGFVEGLITPIFIELFAEWGIVPSLAFSLFEGAVLYAYLLYGMRRSPEKDEIQETTDPLC